MALDDALAGRGLAVLDPAKGDLELMKSEMARLTREKSEAERSLASTQQSVQQMEGTLEAALAIACDVNVRI